ncbi:MAG TPA: threonylcarbamoyl-AMP synthase [Flavobacteriales bacterium]|nr:threonylcarbamoyl-AMP synthase [Flavobacteriales bacterium]
MQTEINKALATLKAGGIILYPTDTIWGLGCDATNTEAVAKIYLIKKRVDSNALISLVADKNQLQEHTTVSIQQAENCLPTTIIYQQVCGLTSNLLGGNKSAAIRIVQDDFCKQLIQIFGKAIVSTSANISGNQAPKQFSEISDEIKKNVDYIVNLRQNELRSTPSTILMINEDGSIKKIR